MRKFRQIISPFLFVLPLVIYLATFVPPYVLRARLAIIFPYQLDGEEGFILNQALLLSRGQSIYQPIKQYPFIVGNYTPFYPALINAYSLEEEIKLSTGRIISAVCVAGVMFLLLYIVFSLTHNVSLSLLAPLLFLITYDNYEWIAYCRVDYLAVVLSAAGLGCVLIGKGKPFTFLLSALMFFLAFFTKQSQIAAPIAVFIWLLVQKKTWQALFFAIILLGSILTCFLILMLATKGEVYRHLVLYNVNIFSLWQLKQLLLHFWLFNKFLILLSALFLIWELARMTRPFVFFQKRGGIKFDASQSSDFGLKQPAASSPKPETRLVSVYFIVSMLTLLGLGKEGAAPNYFIEPEFALALFLSVKSQEFYQIAREKKTSAGLILFIIIFGLFVGHCWNLRQLKPALFSHHNPDTTDIKKAEELMRIIAEHPGDIISEYPIFNIYNGRAVLFQPFIMSALAKQKLWDPEPFIADIQRHRFSLIIATNDLFKEGFYFRWAPEIIRAIRASYKPYTEIVRGRGINYFIYEPRTD